MDLTKLQRCDVAIFLKGKEDPTYTRLSYSEQLEFTFNSEVEEKWYIKDKAKTKNLIAYDISLPQEVETLKGASDYDMIFEMAYHRVTGEAAKRECVVVFLKEPGMSADFLALQTQASIVINSMNFAEGKITFDINFSGDIVEGTATMLEGQPTFKPAGE